VQGWGLAQRRIEAAAELGVRLDGGGTNRGVGAETGGRLEFSRPPGLSGWVEGRWLLAHEVPDLEEWGASSGCGWIRRQAGRDRGLNGRRPAGGRTAERTPSGKATSAEDRPGARQN